MGKARGWQPPEIFCVDGEEWRYTCWDGTVIVAFRCVNGHWVRTGETCPIDEPPPCPEVPCPPGECDELTYKCWDGTIINYCRCDVGDCLRSEEVCPIDEPPPPGFPRGCNLLQAVVFLNRCSSFWRGERKSVIPV